MTYVFAFDHPHDTSLEELKALVGGKGANLALMTRQLGLPVPPGFTVSTEACRLFLTAGWPQGLDDELADHIRRLELAVGRRLGDPSDPLLVSVRSGAPVSMPGMMDTILNLGLNSATAEGLRAVTEQPGFVEACHDRFIATYRDVVGVSDVPEDPWRQLRGAIEAVFRSWKGDRARAYREHEGIADDLGTGVNVQTMVFGNRGPDSATGVVFTRNPATGEAVLYGDILFDAQGEDVVAGTHATEPISVLAERMPDVAAQLRRYANTLEYHYADVCDIEFTIEEGRLWMLQTRIGKRSPQAALRVAVEMAEDPDFPLTREQAVRRVARHLIDPPRITVPPAHTAPVVATGLAASPGVASGEVAINPEAAVARADEGHDVILVRRETSPDDVHGMARSKGILTATGGLASHAAVVARGWGIPAVVGASSVRVAKDHIVLGEQIVATGSVITINGGTGEVMIGSAEGETVIVPEAVTLQGWADELGIALTPKEHRMAEQEPTGTEPGEIASESLIRALMIKGFAMPGALAEAFATSEEEVAASLDGLVADGVAGIAGTMFQLTDDGKAVGAELIESDRKRWGVDQAETALDGFIALDARVKDIVTAWQMREIDGEMTLNDHTDAEYDEAVLRDFAAVVDDADAWLRPLREELARLDDYRTRLERAAKQVASGDHRYIASPRFDSYHTVWFELHEDLILLAGRTREDEVAAGRA